MEVQNVNYCLYARKSSESDERQTMSIDSQIKEMTELAVKEGLQIRDIRSESHSAKDSGIRPVFGDLIKDIGRGEFGGILTWAPDRLSRNAGDLGQLVDLMDQGKLQQIRTYSQTFTNDPGQKFLLMILCSQAKLENDQKGINVKRGIRAKCEMGWRPGPAPIGYMNVSQGGVKKIIPDPERADNIKEMFELVGEKGWSGWDIKRMFDKENISTPTGKQIALSAIYRMLKNTFYYGTFEYPQDSNNWYEGAHEPLVSKELFDKTQVQLTTSTKSPWGSKSFVYKKFFKCGGCKGSITAEEKFKRLKNGRRRRHVYYHCTRSVYNNCKEPYINERNLEKDIVRFITEELGGFRLSEKIVRSIRNYEELRDDVLDSLDVYKNVDELDLVAYAKHILRKGEALEKQELIKGLNMELFILDRKIVSGLS